MLKLELTKRQWEVITNAMQCYANDTRSELDHYKKYHGIENPYHGGNIDEIDNIHRTAGELKVCHNLLEKLQGNKHFY
jgi:hypothetical protein